MELLYGQIVFVNNFYIALAYLLGCSAYYAQ